MSRWNHWWRLAAIAALGLVSCAPVADSRVLGKWHTPTGGTIQFKRDGTAIMAGPLGSRDVRYQMLDDHTVEFSRSDSGGTIRWEIVSASQDELVVKGVDGGETRLTRGD
jgi:hypothetical protein